MNKNELISKVKELDALTLEEKSQLIDLINRKRYGLVWEDKPEDAEELLNEALPVLSEVKERAIIYKPETDEEQAPNHILIEGDNLHALTSLCFTHENKIDVIYIDPPYNTGNKDFRYYDSRYDEVREVDKENPFRHSMWLSFIGKRLRLAKRLLKDTGVIFISIDDNEQSQLKLLCDEIFGETNFITQCVLINNIAGRSDKKHIALSHEYVLVYQKSNLFESTGIELNESLLSEYKFEDKNGKYRLQGLRKRGANSRREDRPNLYYSIFYSPSLNEVSLEKKDGFIEVLPKLSDGADGNWRWGKNTLLEKKDRLLVKLSNKKYEVFEKVYLFDEFGSTKTTKLKSFLFDSDYTTDTATSYFKEIVPSSNFNNPKSPFLIKDLLKISTPNKKEIVLDFFAGSGTTLNATLLLNKSDNGTRQCILVTNNENNICEEVTYLRNKKVIEGYTKPNGESVEGLKKNNLRYYKSIFTGREKTLKNKRDLTELATELLCIKENCYNEIKSGKQIRIFQEKEIAVVIIYDDIHIPAAIELIKKMPQELTIKVYVFAEGQDPYTEDFYEVGERVQLCALPDAIYKAFQNILPKKRKIRNEVTEEV